MALEPTLAAGRTEVFVTATEAEMGLASVDFVTKAVKEAADAGKRPVFWMMAAPSGFAFYSALVAACRSDRRLAVLCRDATWFQFDDYPVPRGDARFPITFRHLLETRLFGPLAEVCGPLRDIQPLEIGARDDDAVTAAYARRIEDACADESSFVMQLKGIGMDGHWGFHGHETRLDAAPGMVKVPMNAANVYQQMLDWPEYFQSVADVPAYAVTCTVQLFLKAHLIVDNVPQATKIFSVLAAYGTDAITGLIPSSAVKAHPNSYAWLTADSAWALLQFRRLREEAPGAGLSPEARRRLEAVWASPDIAVNTANVDWMNGVLRELGMV